MFTTLKGDVRTDLAQTSLDNTFMDEFDLQRQPDQVRAEDPLFFNQETSDKRSYIDHVTAGPGQFEQIVEDGEYPETTINAGDRVVHTHGKFAKSLSISEDFIADDQWNVVQNEVRKMGENGRKKRIRNAIESSYGDAFSGATTNEGTAMISDSHTNQNGDNVDNLETGVMNADNFNTLVSSLRKQKAQDGTLGSYHADGALFPTVLHQTAHEVLRSELKAGTGNNDDNYFSAIYPGLRIGVNEYLDSDFNTLNSNADTSYFVLSRNHGVQRTVRQSLVTRFVDPRFDSRGRGFYRAYFREEVHPVAYNGLVGSNGTV